VESWLLQDMAFLYVVMICKLQINNNKQALYIQMSSNNKNNQAWCGVLWSFLKDKQSKKTFFYISIKRRKMFLNVFIMILKNTESISIYFLILGIDIDIRIFPVKKYNIDIWRIKRYFTVPKYWFTEHWSCPTYLHKNLMFESISNFVFIILSGNFLTKRTILSWLMASRLSCETQSFVTLTFSIITLAKWAFQMTTNGPFHCLQREFWSFFFYSIHFSRPKLNVSCKKGFCSKLSLIMIYKTWKDVLFRKFQH